MPAARFQSFEIKSEGQAGPERLKRLRALLPERGLDGYLVARADEHQNEYLPPSEERLAWLTGFTGSAGFGVVLMDRAAVFTDGRYTEQLAEQIDRSVYEPVSIIDHPPSEWLAGQAKTGARIGYDPRRHTPDQLQRFQQAAERAGLHLVASEPNAVDAVWTERPAPPLAPVGIHPARLAGVALDDKVRDLQQWLAAEKLDGLAITDPTGIAWLFNIRGGDVPHMPLPIGNALLPREGRPKLFIDGRKLSNSVRASLEDRLDVDEPAAFAATLKALGQKAAKLRFDRESASIGLVEDFRASGGAADVGLNPIALRKAVKNKAECEGARQAQIRDGAAMVQFLCWLDAAAARGGETEISAAIALEGFRMATGKLKDISFDTISAAGPNAALPHYRVNEVSNRRITKGIYLIDSGGQYIDGTTDITRTIAIGKPTAEMIDRNTRVLKGMIAVSLAVFPKGASGAQIDSFARQHLWAAGLDFDHGTGHGVGSYLSVHEGPQRIAKTGSAPLEPGMILSNEPGYYKPGHYGIRIENLVLVERRSIPGAEREIYGFETLTLCPIDRRLIKPALLTEAERRWLNAYHARVLKVIGPLVDKPVKTWLKKACASL
ncbi:MAG: aminopeptidase P family protein [Methylocystis sp.]|nr:aminopeptidase P family protein [Methylocystis sp.]MCA3583378.1 aminopeptidase P family protein [Methylocystis sp.]MCA3589758.1 aminopeptidase P family protein [Methylocystis sp.]MCA3591897.1 aminopeptidase P family protein [Methylocystis sp.]